MTRVNHHRYDVDQLRSIVNEIGIVYFPGNNAFFKDSWKHKRMEKNKEEKCVKFFSTVKLTISQSHILFITLIQVKL